MIPLSRSLTGFGPNTPNASCSAIRKTVQNTTVARMSEASNRLRCRAVFRDPRSTIRSKPTRSKKASVSFISAFAMKYPTSRMTRNPRNLGTNVATLVHASVRPCWISTATMWNPLGVSSGSRATHSAVWLNRYRLGARRQHPRSLGQELPETFRDDHGAVRLLVVLQDRDQCPADRRGRSVERVERLHRSVRTTHSRLGSARPVVGVVRAGRELAVALLAR